jgi:hypothetical protein
LRLISGRGIENPLQYSLSVQENLALVIYVQLCDAFQQRRLPAAGSALEDQNVVLLQVQIDVLTRDGETEVC